MAAVVAHPLGTLRNTSDVSLATTASTGRELKKAFGWPRRVDDFDNNLGPELKSQGTTAIPQLSLKELLSITEEQKAKIREAGSVVIRGLFDASLAAEWQSSNQDYIQRNRAIVSGIPRNAEFDKKAVWDIYWSPQQVAARSHQNMLDCQVALNKVWVDSNPQGEEPLDLNQPSSYADRARHRHPGDAQFALGPHIDSGSLERWQDPQYRSVYKDILSGNFEKFQDYDIRPRLSAHQDLYGGTAASSVLRTWQGWISLSSTGPAEGSLSVYPSQNDAIAYVILRPFFAPPLVNGKLAPGWEDPRGWSLDTSSAFPGSTGGKSQELGAISHPHLRLRECMVPIPKVERGDAVFWHCDGIHAVDPVHTGKETASVFYIGALPKCRMNDEYLEIQLESFKKGHAPPDYRTDDGDGEAKFEGFLGVRGLTNEAGQRAMGMV